MKTSITLTNAQFQTLVQRIDVAKLSTEAQAKAVAKATDVLTKMHQITKIERIQNLAGAIGLLEGRMLAILRSAKAQTPEYEPHPVMAEAFLNSDPFGTAPAPAANVEAANAALDEILGA